MPRPKNIACCKPRSSHGAARLHWTHADDCLLLPGREIDPFDQHPAGTNLANLRWVFSGHRVGCRCHRCVYAEVWLDRDDDITDVEVSEL